MTATFDDAKAGWEILRAAGFTLDRVEVNARLKSQGFKPISARTFAHYNKLRRYGYASYIPINQLDVKTLRDPLFDQAVRGRYPVYQDALEVHILGSRAGEDFEIRGETVVFSSAFLRLRVDDPEALELVSGVRFRRDLRASRVTVMFPGTEAGYPAQVEDFSFDAEQPFASLVVGCLT